jgi:hypothetical protein
MDFLTNTSIGLFIIIVAPGFLSLKIWGLIHPTRHTSLADSLYEAIFYGVLNYFLIVQWLPKLLAKINSVFEIIAYIISLVIVPLLLPLLWKNILSLKFIKQKTINSVPKAWDFFFAKHLPCFMLIHLKNGQMIGGLYSDKSSASTYPESEDLYLEQVWVVDSEGRFYEPVEGTMGLLVNNGVIDYIEIYKPKVEGE